jgi:DNA polymerase III epsilon subunit family exonuclease
MPVVAIIFIVFLLAFALWSIFTNREARSGSTGRHPVATRPRTDDAVATALRLSVPEHFVVFDLETTGLDPTRHEIIEVGAIRVNRESDVHDTFQCLVKPNRRIPKLVTKINGISQDMVDRDGETLEAALKDFAEFVGNLPLVSFNAEFDMAFLQASAKRHQITIDNPVCCALQLAREAWPGRGSYKLQDLATDGKLNSQSAHRALEDCRVTVLVYTAAVTKLAMKGEQRAARTN